MNFQNELNKNKELFINRLIELLKINSIYDETTIKEKAPFGDGIEHALTYMIELATKDGFKTVKDGGYAGHIEYGTGEEIIGILCHLDVVPVGDDWSHDPFDPITKDGKIFARGAMDDKGPTMAVYSALKIIKELNIPLKNKIRIILGTDEETGWRGIDHYFQNYEMPKIGFAPDADFPLIYGEKGIIHGYLKGNGFENEDVVMISGGSRLNIVMDKAKAITRCDHSFAFYQYLEKHHLLGSFTQKNELYHYEIIGTAAHAMEPFKGVNAGSYMCNFLKDYTKNTTVHFVSEFIHEDFSLKKLGLEYINDEMGSLTCNLGLVEIENTATIGLDLRYPIGFDYDHFISVLTNLGLELSITLHDFSNKVPHYVDPTDPLVTGLYQIYVKHTNDIKNKPYTIGGGTYARALQKAVAFGMEMPGDETVAHQKDEYIRIDAYLQAILIYIDAILFLGDL